jgi:hypothetical protein
MVPSPRPTRFRSSAAAIEVVLTSDTLIPKSDKSSEANQGSAPYSPCFEATAQVGMEEGLLRLKRMIVDFRLPIAD